MCVFYTNLRLPVGGTYLNCNRVSYNKISRIYAEKLYCELKNVRTHHRIELFCSQCLPNRKAFISHSSCYRNLLRASSVLELQLARNPT